MTIISQVFKFFKKNIFVDIKDYIIRLVNRFKKAYAELNPQSEAAQALMNAQDKLEKIQKLWVEGVVAAAEVRDQVQINESKTKGKNSDRDVDNYTEKEYNGFEWVRKYDIISSGLGKMYVADERFKKNIDKYGEGTAEFASKAIAVFCQEK